MEEHPDSALNILNSIQWKDLDSDRQRAMYSLLYDISQKCGSWYFYEGTFTFPWKVQSFLRSMTCFSSVHSSGYSFEKVTESIDKNLPLIIYGMPSWRIDKSHAWNIDGYKIKSRVINKKVFTLSRLVSDTYRTETVSMVHCDFGWGGKANGYYVSGIFKTKDINADMDSGSSNSQNYNFNCEIHLITYRYTE